MLFDRETLQQNQLEKQKHKTSLDKIERERDRESLPEKAHEAVRDVVVFEPRLYECGYTVIAICALCE